MNLSPDSVTSHTETPRHRRAAQPHHEIWSTNDPDLDTTDEPPPVPDDDEWASIIAAAEDHTSTVASEEDAALNLVDWGEFWAGDHEPEQWIVEPILADGRAHAIVAPAKTGKSLLLQEIAPALATGRPVLRQPSGPPRTVLYLDLENSQADLRERLEAFAYGPDDDLSRLHYSLMPEFPPLDTLEGGESLVAHCERLGVEVVLIDTFARTIGSEENSADGINNYYRHTGRPLKAAGITVVRLDHIGKDRKKGARGSSAKTGDVDIVWLLEERNGGLSMKATHRRVSWVPERIDLERHEDEHGVLSHRTDRPIWAKGTIELASEMEHLGIPVDISGNEAQKMLTEIGEGRSRVLVQNAQKYRHHHQNHPPEPLTDSGPEPHPEPPGEYR